MLNVCARRLLEVATVFGCAPYLVSASSRWAQKSPVGEFRVSPSNLLCGVSLPGGGIAGVGVDERVEGASGRPPGFILLDVDQVDQAAPIRPLVESHGGVAIFDDANQAPDEVDAVRTVISVAVTSVNLDGNRLVHVFSSGRKSGQDGGGVPRPNPRLSRP